MSAQPARSHAGFTLVELLIVVIILAILAAIVVPQFASSTDEAKMSSLDTTLANVRAAIDLYYQQHGEYPGDNTANNSQTCPNSGTPAAATATADTDEAFLAQLSMYTTANGLSCSTKDGTYKYGPYLKKGVLPKNPITEDNTLAIATAGDLNMVGDGAGLGWKYDTQNGKFIANDTNTDPGGVRYDAH